MTADTKRVTIRVNNDSENTLNMMSALTNTPKSEIIEASIKLLIDRLEIHDGMTIADLRNALLSFFK